MGIETAPRPIEVRCLQCNKKLERHYMFVRDAGWRQVSFCCGHEKQYICPECQQDIIRVPSSYRGCNLCGTDCEFT